MNHLTQALEQILHLSDEIGRNPELEVTIRISGLMMEGRIARDSLAGLQNEVQKGRILFPHPDLFNDRSHTSTHITACPFRAGLLELYVLL